MKLTWGLLSKYKSEIYGFSILWIVLFHGLVMIKAKLPINLFFLTNFIKHGNCGVEVFIFMSGITLYFSCIKNQNAILFYIRRLSRVMIPVLIIDGVYWGYTCIIRKGDFIQFFKNITTYSFWFENNRTIWFVALILIIYLVYPFLYRLWYKNEKLKTSYITIGSIIMAYLMLIGLASYNYKLYRALEIALTRIPVFLLGMGCAPLVYNNEKLTRNVVQIIVFGVVAFLVYYYINPISLIKSFRFPYFILGPSIAISCAILLELASSKKINEFLSFYGSISLEMYLSHVSLCNMCKLFKIFGKNPVHNYYKYIFICILFATIASVVANRIYNNLKK